MGRPEAGRLILGRLKQILDFLKNFHDARVHQLQRAQDSDSDLAGQQPSGFHHLSNLMMIVGAVLIGTTDNNEARGVDVVDLLASGVGRTNGAQEEIAEDIAMRRSWAYSASPKN
ncbi:hypothetical protein B7494_g1971 [Chlorociboria aeruginascens]|nr:hypothetical protein B7494_g1971 [Chlorociboria aeruginascens]